MAEKTKENKVILERTYVIPIKRKLRHIQDYKKARKAVKIVLEFIAKHMRVEDRDVRKVKMDKLLNHELWFRGMKSPPNKIKVKTKKMSDGIVHVELFEIPKILQFKVEREKRQRTQAEKEAKKQIKEESHEGHDHSHADENKDGVKDSNETKEKQASTMTAGLEKQALEAKSQKHQVMQKPIKRQTPVQRNIPKSK